MTPVLVVLALLGAANAALFPLPAQMSTGTGTAYLTPSFGFFCAAGGVCSDTLKAAMTRYLALVPSGSSSPSAALSECSIYVATPDETLNAKTDESYNIVIHAGDCFIGAGTVYGAIHGLETLSQMFVGRSIANVPISITDQPRFAFRALMIDTSRHFLPVPFIEHIIDTMVMSKLNVLHWHIVDSNSFPCGSRTFPELAEKGAYDPQAIYTTQQMGAIVAYAQQRGVRIIPEWDVPGHGSWGAGIPSLMGCSDVLDPTQNATYSFLVSFFQEMETIFIDDYIFLGGDEVDHTCWDQNPAIAAWLKSHSMTSSQLEQYFWQRVSSDVLPKLKKTLGVWEADNIQVDLANLPPGSYGNAYQSQSTLAKITTAGYNAVLSGPWYLDQENPAGCHEYAWQEVWQCMYNVEPLQGLTPAQSALVLGGEICMWAEGVNDKNFDSRTWDRSAAVGERLWSPANVQINTNNTQSRLMEHICRMDQRGVRASPIEPNFCPTDETFLDTRIKQLEQELALLRSKQ